MSTWRGSTSWQGWPPPFLNEKCPLTFLLQGSITFSFRLIFKWAIVIFFLFNTEKSYERIHSRYGCLIFSGGGPPTSGGRETKKRCRGSPSSTTIVHLPIPPGIGLFSPYFIISKNSLYLRGYNFFGRAIHYIWRGDHYFGMGCWSDVPSLPPLSIEYLSISEHFWCGKTNCS